MSAGLADLSQFISAVDGYQCREGADTWFAEVLGVHSDGRDVWMQVGRRDDPDKTAVLRLSQWATPRHAIAALSECRGEGDAYPKVIPVMHIVKRPRASARPSHR